MNKSYPYTARRGVVGKVIIFLYKKHMMHGHTVRLVFCFPFYYYYFLFWSLYPMIRGEILIYVFPDIPWGYIFNYLSVPLALSNPFHRATVSLTFSYTEMIHG